MNFTELYWFACSVGFREAGALDLAWVVYGIGQETSNHKQRWYCKLIGIQECKCG